MDAVNSEPNAPHPLETRLDVARQMPRLSALNLGVIAVVAAALFVWPCATTRRGGWTAGPVTNHHRLLEPACDSCHSERFAGTPDAPCVACHDISDHAAPVPAIAGDHPQPGGRCASCHREHHGEENLVPAETTLCTGCHAGMRRFADHPELTPEVRAAAGLKFSHALHLSSSAAPTCASCHEVDAAGDLRPVAFADHCAGCHTLELDGAPDSPTVPHGDHASVLTFVRGEPTRRDFEAALFTEGGTCVRCHDVERVTDPAADASQFRVVPVASGRRMPGASFGHATHRLTPCQDCHAGVAGSQSAADVLLPSIAVCRQCHADPGTPGKIESPCLQCHRYHGMDSLPIDEVAPGQLRQLARDDFSRPATPFVR